MQPSFFPIAFEYYSAAIRTHNDFIAYNVELTDDFGLIKKGSTFFCSYCDTDRMQIEFYKYGEDADAYSPTFTVPFKLKAIAVEETKQANGENSATNS